MRTRSITKTVIEADDEGLKGSQIRSDFGHAVLSPNLINSRIEDQATEVIKKFTSKYPGSEAPKKLQVDSVVSLIQGCNTFLLAGTGYGKSRIPELFYHMFARHQKAVILTLNPLDALGDNQVLEKKECKNPIRAINLTKLTFNKQVIKRLEAGEFPFIYVSPEIFLHNVEFQRMYHSAKFQSHLVLKVVDEAHMIYTWGLSTKGILKHFSKHVTPEDSGQFRPSYGNLGQQLMATDDIPLLLMSATCPKPYITQILTSLKITEDNITMLRGELTRPNVRFIRVYLQHPLDSAQDLARIIPLASHVPNDQVPKSLFYSGSQNGTRTIMDVASRARGTPEEASNGNSSYIRRYHSVTGERDKLTRADEYGKGVFSTMACTSALGLGQNWKDTRIVAVMGSMDPAEQTQMVGRGGRDGRESLGILFVQPRRPQGMNSIKDFPVGKSMDSQVAMDAMRVTPVCLRIAYAVNNSLGHVPLSTVDPDYMKESEREKSVKMTPCRCSNCDPHSCAYIIRNLPKVSIDQFDNLLKTNPSQTEDISLFTIPDKPSRNKRKFSSTLPQVCKFDDPIRLSPPFVDLAVSISGHFEILFNQTYPNGSEVPVSTLMNRDEVWEIVKNYRGVMNGVFLRQILGGQTIDGQFDLIVLCIKNWMSSQVYLQHLQQIEDDIIAQEQEILDDELRAQERKEAQDLIKSSRQKKRDHAAEVKMKRLEAQVAKAAARELAKEVKKAACKKKLEQRNIGLVH